MADYSISGSVQTDSSVTEKWHDVAISWLNHYLVGKTLTPEECYILYDEALEKIRTEHGKLHVPRVR